ncbi:MAG: hypothetical protein LWX70_12300 [Sphingobacteriia bacterium]|nr:hypothetical protein [Sphingobacteriia bacterium]
MKKLHLIFVLLFTGSTLFGQSVEMLFDSLTNQISKAEKPSDYALLAASFNALTAMESAPWEAGYYHSYCLLMEANGTDTDSKKDALLDQAETKVNELLKMMPREDELYVLRAFINQVRISVSPMMRGMKYSGLANDDLAVAIEIDKNNPRAWFLKAMNTYYTPAMFGGGKEKACPLFQKASGLFAGQNKEAKIGWGAEINSQMLKSCGQ